MTTTDQAQKVTLGIRGMHCPNCEVLIERRIKSLPGVVAARANQHTGQVEIHSLTPLDTNHLQRALAEEGYSLGVKTASGQRGDKNTAKDYVEIGAVLVVLLGGVLVVQHFGWLPRGLSVSENMSYGVVFLIGLVASVSSCIAVTGGLLVAVAAKYNDASGSPAGLQRLKPLIWFNAGRIISYTLLGGAVGALGSALKLSEEANGILTIVASVIMIVFGLQMLKLFPSLGRLLPKMPRLFGHKIHDLAAREAQGGAFVLGACTFFLPCGFTQALQVYVLAKGSFTIGALTMLAFALGTLPALLSLSAVSSFAKGAFQRHFLKFAGAAVIVLGLVNIQYGFVLTGREFAPISLGAEQTTPPQRASMEGDKQVVVMRIEDFGYVPNRFIVQQGVPVEWRIDASDAAACGRFLLAPKLGIRKLLSSNSTTIISFTPRETGEFAFNCGMGMMTPGSAITVIPRTAG